jgi:hypothetical protein
MVFSWPFDGHQFFSQSPFSAKKGAKWWGKKEKVGEEKRLSHHAFFLSFPFYQREERSKWWSGEEKKGK